jgi:hypothetical protein
MTLDEILAAIDNGHVTDDTFPAYHHALIAHCLAAHSAGLIIPATFAGDVREYYLSPDRTLRLRRDAHGVWRRLP